MSFASVIPTVVKPAPLNRALNFNGTGTPADFVNHGHGLRSILDDLDPISVGIWCRPTTIDTTFRRIVYKDNGTGRFQIIINDNPDLNTFATRRDTDATNSSSRAVANTIQLGTWNFIGNQHDIGRVFKPQMWWGDLNNKVTEVTYALQTIPTGNLASEASANWLTGKRDDGSAFEGDIFWVGVWNRYLALYDWERMQRGILGRRGLVASWYYDNTVRILDESGQGNRGVVTGTKWANSAPLERLRLDDLHVVGLASVVAGLSIPTAMYNYRRRRIA